MRIAIILYAYTNSAFESQKWDVLQG